MTHRFHDMAVRSWLGALSVLVACAPALAAQRVWQSTWYPYLYYQTADGLWIGARYTRYSPIGFVERPEPNAVAFSLDAAGSVQGSYAVTADAQAPALWNGWRVGLTLRVARENRLGFYGIGNETAAAADSVTATAPYYYQVSRTHGGGRFTLERRLIGPLRALAGATFERTDFRPLPGPSVFRASVASGVVDSTAIPFNDGVVRVGLVVDTRDNELDPHAGILVEGLFASGQGYTRTTGVARAYAHPLERLVIAARVAGEGMGGGPPVAAQVTMESGARSFIAVGGYQSLRGYYDARFIGPAKLLAGAEMRYAVVLSPTVVEVKVVAFYDAGRVFGPGESFRLTTDGLHHAGGVELALRALRNGLVVAGAGVSSEGAQYVFGTRWTY
jgi:outer membrane protein assembly factor BamA